MMITNPSKRVYSLKFGLNLGSVFVAQAVKVVITTLEPSMDLEKLFAQRSIKNAPQILLCLS